MPSEDHRGVLRQWGFAATSLALFFAANFYGLGLDPAGRRYGALLAAVAVAMMALAVLQRPSGRRLSAAKRLGTAFALFAVFLVVWQDNRSYGEPRPPELKCQSQLRQQATALLLYTADFDGRFPLSDSWYEAAQPYYPWKARCPTAKAPWSYAMNESVSGYDIWTEPGDSSDLVLLFEADGEMANTSAGIELLALRHEGRANIAMCDGHVTLNTRQQAATMRWGP